MRRREAAPRGGGRVAAFSRRPTHARPMSRGDVTVATCVMPRRRSRRGPPEPGGRMRRSWPCLDPRWTADSGRILNERRGACAVSRDNTSVSEGRFATCAHDSTNYDESPVVDGWWTPALQMRRFARDRSPTEDATRDLPGPPGSRSHREAVRRGARRLSAGRPGSDPKGRRLRPAHTLK